MDDARIIPSVTIRVIRGGSSATSRGSFPCARRLARDHRAVDLAPRAGLAVFAVPAEGEIDGFSDVARVEMGGEGNARG